MLYIEDLIVIVRWLALIVAIIDIVLVAYILLRRIARDRYYARKDAARERFSAVVSQFGSGISEMSQTAMALSKACTPAETAAVQELLIGSMTVENRERVSDLLFQLGYVQTWAIQAFGKRRGKELMAQIASGQRYAVARRSWNQNFRKIRRLRVFAVKRALPVAYFGHLAPRFAERLLAEALQDPSPYVTRPAVAALGKTLSPVAVPILLEQLRKASKGKSDIPVRAAKAALVRHSSGNLSEFLPFLESREERLRLLVVDTIREMLNSKPLLVADVPVALYDWFIDQAVQDTSADVRARSAAVISRFHDRKSIDTLRALLRDEDEYVRLHSVRACADPFYSVMVEDLVGCMTDRRWRVREAAAKSLAAVGSAGTRSLADFFLTTNDRYASEQTADELQRSGLIFQLVSMLGTSDLEAGQAAAVCRKMAGMGMTSLFSYLLQRDLPVAARNELAKILESCSAAQSESAGRQANNADDPTKNRTAPFLGAATPVTAAAGE